MEEMTSKKLKSMAKGQLITKYPGLSGATLALIFFIVAMALLTNTLVPDTGGLNALSVLCQVLAGIVEAILVYGYTAICMKAVCDMPFRVSDLFEAFKEGAWKPVVITEIMILGLLFALALPGSVFLVLYITSEKVVYMILSIALFALGILGYIYLDVVYSFRFMCLLDFPGRRAVEYLRLSRDILKGHFWKLLYIKLSFIPWKLVVLCSMGIAGLWLKPYFKATEINYYLYLMSKRR